MDAWVARDEDGDIFLYFEKPEYDIVTLRHYVAHVGMYLDVSNTPIDKKYSHLTIEDGPILVVINCFD